MKIKKAVICFCLGLTFFLPFACARKAKIPAAGQAKTVDLIKLLPKNTLGVFAYEVKRSLETSLARQFLADEEVKAKIEEFKNLTGIDLNQDIYVMAGGIISLENKEPQPVLIINLRYDRDRLLPFIRQKSPRTLTETAYGKTIIYQVQSEKENNSSFAFFDNSNIFLGSRETVEKVIDVCEKKAESLKTNVELTSLLKKAKTQALSWSAFLLPSEAMAKIAKSNPMFSPLEKLRSVTFSFDYKNKNLIAEMKAMGSDAAHHKNLADFFTGIRAMGAMAAANYPEVTEVLNRIEITSTSEYVALNFTLPEDLLIKLSERIKKEVETRWPSLKESES